jgi:GNAT superfamily N-acetyltransferase
MSSVYQIRRAQPHELRVVLDLLAQAANWLHSRGIDQWPERFPDERLEPCIAAGETWLALSAGQPIATITMTRDADPEFWRPEDAPEDALYAHKMAVARDWAGRNLGGRLLDWASSQAAAQDLRWLRLDCWKTNTGLQAYYRAQGFSHVRTVDLPHRRSGALFQRPAGSTAGELRRRAAVPVPDSVIDVAEALTMTPEETRLAAAYVRVVEQFSKADSAFLTGGYQAARDTLVEELRGALAALLSSLNDSGDDIRPDVVRQAVALWSQSYSAGRLLYPLEMIGVDEAVRQQFRAAQGAVSSELASLRGRDR